jgi:hypothetical protein
MVVPHSCQNTPALTVIGGHSGDLRRRGDLGSGRYQCRPNKPNKDVILSQELDPEYCGSGYLWLRVRLLLPGLQVAYPISQRGDRLLSN